MDRINLRQFFLIVFLLAVAMKMFMLPTYMMRISGDDSLFVLVCESLIDVVLLIVVLMIMRAHKGTFFETITYAFGKVLARIIAGLLVIFYLAKLFLMLTELRVFFSTSVLYISLSPLHMIPLLLLLIFVSGKRLSVLGRVSEIITPLVIISMVVLGALSFSSVDFSNNLPLISDPRQIKEGMMSFPMWFGDFMLLLVFTGKTDNRKRLYFSLIAAGIGLLFMALFSAMMFALYTYVPEVLTYGHNISNMTQYSVSSFKFGRFDLLVFCIWLLGVLLSAAIMVNFINRCVNFAFGKQVGLYTAFICCTLIVIGMYIFDNANEICDFMIQYLALPAVIIQYGVPITLLIALITRKIIDRIKHKADGGLYDKKVAKSGL